MKKVYKPRKGHRMHQDMLRVAFLKKAKQIYGQSDNIQPSNHNKSTSKITTGCLAEWSKASDSSN